MSDTNRVGLRFFQSSQRTAPIPGGPFNLDQLRFTGTPNLAFAPETTVSEKIRADRQIDDLVLVGGLVTAHHIDGPPGQICRKAHILP